jgi:hypothetical protein
MTTQAELNETLAELQVALGNVEALIHVDEVCIGLQELADNVFDSATQAGAVAEEVGDKLLKLSEALEDLGDDLDACKAFRLVIA